MNIGGIICGAIAAVIGAVAWAAIAYYANVEIGYLAWGIGLLVGLGVSFGSRSGGIGAAVIAVILTVASILGGKYAAVEMAVLEFDASIPEFQMDDDQLKLELAYEFADQAEADGEKLEFRRGKTIDSVEKIDDFPEVIVKEASDRFSRMSEEEKEDFRSEVKEARDNILDALEQEMAQQGFWNSFSPMDIVFFLLAVFTAGKVAMSDVIE